MFSDLPFTWETHRDTYIITDKEGGGCHVASLYEKAMIEEIEHLFNLVDWR